LDAGGPLPSIVIALEFESKAPKVVACWNTDGDEHRLSDWLAAQPELSKLVERALELAEEAQAA